MLTFDLEEMLKKEVAQPYIEDGSIKETAELLLEAQARVLEQWCGAGTSDTPVAFRCRPRDSLMPLAQTLRQGQGLHF